MARRSLHLGACSGWFPVSGMAVFILVLIRYAGRDSTRSVRYGPAGQIAQLNFSS